MRVPPGHGSAAAAPAAAINVALIGGVALIVMLLWDRQFELSRMDKYRPSKKASGLLIAAFIVAFVIIGLDIVSVVLECGPGICPDTPPDNYPFSPF